MGLEVEISADYDANSIFYPKVIVMVNKSMKKVWKSYADSLHLELIEGILKNTTKDGR